MLRASTLTPLSVSVLKPICAGVYVMPEFVCCCLIDGPQPATDSAKDWSGGLNLYLSQRQSSDGCRTCERAGLRRSAQENEGLHVMGPKHRARCFPCAECSRSSRVAAVHPRFGRL